MLEVRVAGAERWSDLVDLFEREGPRGGVPQTSECWCQFWHLRGKAYWEGVGASNRRSLEEEVRQEPEPGLIAYRDGVPVGWCRIGPRDSFDRLRHSRSLAPVGEDGVVWSVVCFFVHPFAKRGGVASALLEAAIARASAAGADVIEGYPVREGHMNIDAYTGYLPMFLSAGFEVVRDAGRRLVVCRQLSSVTSDNQALD